MGGKIIPRIRLTSAKDLAKVEAELGNIFINHLQLVISIHSAVFDIKLADIMFLFLK